MIRHIYMYIFIHIHTETDLVFTQNELFVHIMLYSLQHPTCAVEHGQQYGGDPCSVAVSHAKLPDQLFEKDADCFGESVGEACDDKTAHQHSPAPASVRGLHSTRIHVQCNTSHGALGMCS